MQLLLKAVALLAVISTLLLVIALNDDQEILIESQESETDKGLPVFNKIKWYQEKDRDIWMMNQSHHGMNATESNWDRLAIVIDKSKSPATARFYQFEPGPLQWQENLKEKPLRVSCFICHNNGPRMIRAESASTLAQLSVRNRIQLAYWNIRIKSYGRILPDAYHAETDRTLKQPFRFQGSYANERLQIRPCTYCHKEEGLLARGSLTRQQMPTIRFLSESGHMPPWPFLMSKEAQGKLKDFLHGF